LISMSAKKGNVMQQRLLVFFLWLSFGPLWGRSILPPPPSAAGILTDNDGVEPISTGIFSVLWNSYVAKPSGASWWLGNGTIKGPCFQNSDCLLSTYLKKSLSVEELSRPVAILVHGFTATPFEWVEFAETLEKQGHWYSVVTLGAHGDTLEAFRRSTWQEWAQPVFAEYQALVQRGFKNISIVASSTGAPLVIEALTRSNHPLFSGLQALPRPKHVVMVDPIFVDSGVELAAKLPNIFNAVLPQTKAFTNEEHLYWYAHRPFEAFDQLADLLKQLQNRSGSDYQALHGTSLKIYAADKDSTLAQPACSEPMLKSIPLVHIRPDECRSMDSKIHVFTRLRGRSMADVTPKDWRQQNEVFISIKETIFGK
jgi:carboxylesterase